MSEQAKLAYLQEKIQDAKSHEKSGNIWACVGIGVAVVGFFLYTSPLPADAPKWAMALMGVAGTVGAILGGAEHLYYLNQRDKLTKELEKLAFINPQCPKCGKATPQGNYTFCPFCGSPLTPPPP